MATHRMPAGHPCSMAGPSNPSSTPPEHTVGLQSLFRVKLSRPGLTRPCALHAGWWNWLTSVFSQTWTCSRCTRLSLPSPFPFVQTFGIKADLLGLLPGRQTYVIDVNGQVVLSFNDQFNVEQHVDEALRVRHGRRTARGEGCAATWECTA